MTSRAEFVKYRQAKNRILGMAAAEAAHKIARRREKARIPLPIPHSNRAIGFTIEEIDATFEESPEDQTVTSPKLLGTLLF